MDTGIIEYSVTGSSTLAKVNLTGQAQNKMDLVLAPQYTAINGGKTLHTETPGGPLHIAQSSLRMSLDNIERTV